MTRLWSQPQQLLGTNMASDSIATAIADNGVQWVLWKDSVDGTAFDLRLARRGKDWTWAAAPLLFETGDAPKFPTLLVTPSGDRMLAWQGTVKQQHVICTKLLSKGQTDAPVTVVSNESANSYQPAIAFSPKSGHTVIVYSAAGTILGSRYRENLQRWKTEPVSSESQACYYPAVSVDAETDTLYVAWANIADNSVYVTSSPFGTANWTDPVRLGSGNRVSLAAGHGKVMAMWTAPQSAQYAARVRFLDGDSWGKTQTISTVPSAFDLHGVIDSQGVAHVIWKQAPVDSAYTICYANCTDTWSPPISIAAGAGASRNNSLAIDRWDNLHAMYLAQAGSKLAFSLDLPVESAV